MAGEDAGPAKLAKAQELKIKIINEDEFLHMIIDNSKSSKSNHKDATKDKTKKENVSKGELKTTPVNKHHKVKEKKESSEKINETIENTTKKSRNGYTKIAEKKTTPKKEGVNGTHKYENIQKKATPVINRETDYVEKNDGEFILKIYVTI